MQTILVVGAGKSSIFLIEYLLENASRNKWCVIVADGDAAAIAGKIRNHPSAEAAVIDITKTSEREALVKRADMVLSLMPPHLHILLAHDCLKYKKHLITSSYISDEMRALDEKVKEAGLMFMCEMGLDPGIDHMTASKIINSVYKVAGRISSFKSYCGGLVAPESDNNPWHYKFSWNPRNVVTAGMGGAKFLLNGKVHEVSFEKIFENNKKIKIPGLNALAYYPNRDSLKYPEIYGLDEVKTFLRATLRYPIFCKGWDALIKLGFTNQDEPIDTTAVTYATWMKRKTGYTDTSITVPQHVANLLGVPLTDQVMTLIEWLGVYDEVTLPVGKFNSAEILEELLQRKWNMTPNDKDMVVMHHEIEYEHRGNMINLVSTMQLTGEIGERTAMAKCVGLPIGLLASLVMTKKIKAPVGVVLPTMQSVYKPVLRELERFGIIFRDDIIQ
jgi:saccharopine dehydrogenase (NADP+, L-glutamate forming)